MPYTLQMTGGTIWIFVDKQRIWDLQLCSQNTASRAGVIGRCAAGSRLFYPRLDKIHNFRGGKLPLIFDVVVPMISNFMLTTDRAMVSILDANADSLS